jgi:hypothetical protein
MLGFDSDCLLLGEKNIYMFGLLFASRALTERIR